MCIVFPELVEKLNEAAGTFMTDDVDVYEDAPFEPNDDQQRAAGGKEGDDAVQGEIGLDEVDPMAMVTWRDSDDAVEATRRERSKSVRQLFTSVTALMKSQDALTGVSESVREGLQRMFDRNNKTMEQRKKCYESILEAARAWWSGQQDKALTKKTFEKKCADASKKEILCYSSLYKLWNYFQEICE